MGLVDKMVNWMEYPMDLRLGPKMVKHMALQLVQKLAHQKVHMLDNHLMYITMNNFENILILQVYLQLNVLYYHSLNQIYNHHGNIYYSNIVFEELCDLPMDSNVGNLYFVLLITIQKQHHTMKIHSKFAKIYLQIHHHHLYI